MTTREQERGPRPRSAEAHDGRRRTGRPAVVVANGAEGEPVGRKDTTLLRLSPHPVLDALQSAAHAVGAAEVRLAV